MRSGILFGGALLLAGALSLCALVLPSDPAVLVDLRLDDHETSWPDHLGVQTEAVNALTERLEPFDGAINAREDRSTVKVAGFDERNQDAIDIAINEVIAEDLRTRRNADDIEPMRNQLREAEAVALAAAQSGTTEELILEMTAKINELRSALADSEIQALSGRSRFASIGSTPADGNPAESEQWVLAIGLLLVGIVMLGKDRTVS